MKKIIIILLIVLAIVWGVENKAQVLGYVEQGKNWFNTTVLKKEVEDENEDLASEGAEAKSEKSVTSSSSSKTKASNSTPKAEPIVVEPLPEGFYYTRERVTKVTDLGVAAIAKGVKVQKIGEENGEFIIDDGVNKLSISPQMLTNDPKEAAEILTAIAAAAPAPKTKAAVSSSTVASASAPPVKTGPSQEVLHLRQKVQNLDDRIYQLQKQIRDLEAEHAYAKMRGRVSSVHVQIGRIQGQLNNVQGDRNRAAQQLAAAEQN